MWFLIGIIALVVVAIGAGQAGLLKGKAPTDLGVQNGRLKGLSATDNCVSSQAGLYPEHRQRSYAEIAPLALRGDGPSTLAKLQTIISGMPGALIVTRRPDYLYAQFTTSLMKYTDDLELWFDPQAQVVQVRSASRLGKSDLRANRKRVEALRATLAAAP
jgi:uncharacterized protein (DUF1499 family)